MTMKPPITESYWVEPGRFLAGEYPSARTVASTRDRMNAFLHAKIDTFIDLTQPHELPTYESLLGELARGRQIEPAYHRFAIRDHSVPSRETMLRILDVIDESLAASRNVYVHCWGGIGRTGITVGCFLVRHGCSNEEALRRVNALYRTRPGNPYYPNSPETPEQVEFVSAWREIPQGAHGSKQNFCEG
jgi:hypothetical protein